MNDAEYAQYCRERLREFAATLDIRTRDLPEGDSLRELAQSFGQLEAESIYSEGPALVDRLFTTYPDFAPTFPRELLWFLGGDCLHYMPDDEIQLYQQLDEEREAASERGEVLDMEAARQRLRGA